MRRALIQIAALYDGGLTRMERRLQWELGRFLDRRAASSGACSQHRREADGEARPQELHGIVLSTPRAGPRNKTANAVTLYRRIRVADMMANGPSEA